MSLTVQLFEFIELHSSLLFDQDTTMKDARAFEELYVVKWTDRVSAAALASL